MLTGLVFQTYSKLGWVSKDLKQETFWNCLARSYVGNMPFLSAKHSTKALILIDVAS